MYTGKPDNISVISKESKIVAKQAEEIVVKFNTEHQLEAYDKLTNEGFWRLVLYRESKKTKEVMISFIVTD